MNALIGYTYAAPGGVDGLFQVGDRRAHVVVGTLSGGTAAGILATVSENGNPLLEALGGVLGGYLGGRLPDKLEPAITPLHRSFFHSATFATTGTVAALKYLATAQALDDEMRERIKRSERAMSSSIEFKNAPPPKRLNKR